MTSVDSYLERLEFRRGVHPSEAALADLHEQHLFCVPFENLDIHLGRRIELAEEEILRKIVGRRRGGFCYELNGAFAWLLRQLGYDVQLFAAEVARDDGTFGIPFDHLVLMVQLDRPLLVDVGFGDSFRTPLVMDGSLVTQMGRSYRTRMEDPWTFLERKDGDEPWLPQYRFKQVSHELSQFQEGCDYHQTSPDSHFTQRVTCSLATPSGRITVAKDRIIVTRDGNRAEHNIDDEDSWRAALETHCGVVIDG